MAALARKYLLKTLRIQEKAMRVDRVDVRSPADNCRLRTEARWGSLEHCFED